MDDDWDDGAVVSAPAMTGIISEGGTKFSAGRGYKASSTGNSEWDSNNATSGWDDAPSSGYQGNKGGGRGGRGDREDRGRGHRDGRGRGNREDRGNFRGGRRNDNDNNGEWETPSDSWGENGNGNGFSSGGDFESEGRGGRGRGGRGGRGRGGRGGFRNEERSNDWGGGDSKNGGGGRFGGKEDGEDDGAPPKPRDIYVPEERVTDDDLFTTTITSGVNFMKLDEIEVKVTGENVPNPLTSFQSSELRPHLLKNIEKSGYTKPTPIQKYAIPIILAGRDLMGCAQTGSGKTAAFLLPMINKILASQEAPETDGNTCNPKVVVVSPTRELAIQINEQARKFAHNSIVKCAVAYGGTSVSHQRNVVKEGCHILVATPGRLNDFVTRGHVSFSSVQFFVLDEADRMLDMGFLPTVEEMLGHASMTATGERQTLMFSATFPEEIQHLAGKFLHNYVFVAVGIVGSASTDVTQEVHLVTRFEKRTKLIEMLKGTKERTVVFVETKRNADFLATFLSENDIQSTSIHGDRLQREREQALWDIKKGIRHILVATGVAARGLDIEGIQHVINYDLPKSIDEYVHRIGRTGRVGNSGKATSLFDESCDRALAGPLANILRQAGQNVPDFLSNAGGGGGGDSDIFGGRDIRGDDFGKGQNFVQQPAEIEEEDW
ncbi:ATP-dependent RNA helicase vasa [Sitophilus oryzae]|uniref:RNA helicase n=1 Tax=Sitophilus oryzae TaxID=7048 RepID=A0A6J2YPP2_SITOR|nr:ATP-dependent RNA helicase vasa [Sitophilus oryzae]